MGQAGRRCSSRLGIQELWRWDQLRCWLFTTMLTGAAAWPACVFFWRAHGLMVCGTIRGLKEALLLFCIKLGFEMHTAPELSGLGVSCSPRAFSACK